MSKRLFRLQPKQILASNIDFEGQPVTLVLKNGTTFLGNIIKTDGNIISFELKFGKKIDFDLSAIAEIIYDKASL